MGGELLCMCAMIIGMKSLPEIGLGPKIDLKDKLL